MKRRSTKLLLATLLLSLAGCAAPREETTASEAEIVDVAPPKDVALTFDEDVQSDRREVDLAGVLPGGFPQDLPIFLPASVVDDVETADGRRLVTLQHPARPVEVEGWLGERLPAAGWKRVAEGRYQDGSGKEVDLRIEELGGSTRVHVTY